MNGSLVGERDVSRCGQRIDQRLGVMNVYNEFKRGQISGELLLEAAVDQRLLCIRKGVERRECAFDRCLVIICDLIRCRQRGDRVTNSLGGFEIGDLLLGVGQFL